MGDIGEDFNAFKQASKEKRSDNRENSAALLTEHGISFKTRNNGAHLIVEGRDGCIDFWPGTGKFIARDGRNGRGVFNVIKLCEKGDG